MNSYPPPVLLNLLQLYWACNEDPNLKFLKAHHEKEGSVGDVQSSSFFPHAGDPLKNVAQLGLAIPSLMSAMVALGLVGMVNEAAPAGGKMMRWKGAVLVPAVNEVGVPF